MGNLGKLIEEHLESKKHLKIEEAFTQQDYIDFCLQAGVKPESPYCIQES